MPTKTSKPAKPPRAQLTPDDVRGLNTISAAQAAALLGVTPSTIYELCRADKIRHMRVGERGSLRIPVTPLLRWLGEVE